MLRCIRHSVDGRQTTANWATTIGIGHNLGPVQKPTDFVQLSPCRIPKALLSIHITPGQRPQGPTCTDIAETQKARSIRKEFSFS